jgi:tRNA (cytidine/uridine-2'-O-)-methyltransferase
MLHVALWEPEIPPNTGNVARLCAATGATLHLIGRLGFHLDDRSLRRAGLDYWPAVTMERHIDFEAFRTAVLHAGPARLLCLSAHATTPYTAVQYRTGDVLMFGSESRGLPPVVLAAAEQTLTIPMLTDKVRSLNLAAAVGIVLYEALRQLQSWQVRPSPVQG